MTQRFLNPFALSPETNGRFRLLMLLAFALALDNASLLRYIVLPEPPATVSMAPSGAPSGETVSTDESDFQRTQRQIREAAEATRANFAMTLAREYFSWGLTVLMFATAVVLYRRHPYTIAKRSTRLTPSLPTWEVRLQSLSKRIGLTVPPRFELAHRGGEQGGQAYGLPRRYAVQLGDHMRLVYARARDRFDALVLHELGHIANRDIGRSYFVQALWTAMVVLIWIPLLIGIVYLIVAKIERHWGQEPSWRVFVHSFPFAEVIRGVAALLMVMLVRASVLRARELYADARAAQAGARATLGSIFRAAVDPVAPWWRKWFWLHPSPSMRAQALDDPMILFALRPTLGFVAAVLQGATVTGLLVPVLMGLSGIIVAGQQAVVVASTDADVAAATVSLFLSRMLLIGFIGVASLGLGWLLCGTVVPQLIRFELARSVFAPGPRWSYLRLIAACGLGFEGGLALSLLAGLWYSSPTFGGIAFAVVAGVCGWTAVAAITLVVTRWNIRRWVLTRTGNRVPRFRMAWIVFTSSAINGCGLAALLSIRLLPFLAAAPEQRQAGTMIVVVLSVIFGGTVALAALPLFTRRAQCPQCRQKLSLENSRIGLSCPHCHEFLGEWAFVQDRVAVDPPPLPPSLPATTAPALATN